jgi:hypothetical protein
MAHGYQIATDQDLYNRYAGNAPIRLEANPGPLTNAQVAMNALSEMQKGGTRYDLVVNNCECFVNRAMNANSSSSQVVNTAIGLVALVGLCFVLKN